MPKLKQMGTMNAPWGICGFTSALHALYNHSPSTPQRQAELARGAITDTRMLAEIKSYLQILQIENETGLLNSIEEFTRSFGVKYSKFTNNSYIEGVNDVVVHGVNQTPQGKYSIAMPPLAVVDYLKRICGFTNAKVDNNSNNSELILGVKNVKNKTMVKYNGLCHYLYQNHGKIYSWGRMFNSVTAAKPDYRVVCKIVPGRTSFQA